MGQDFLIFKLISAPASPVEEVKSAALAFSSSQGEDGLNMDIESEVQGHSFSSPESKANPSAIHRDKCLEFHLPTFYLKQTIQNRTK